MPPQGRVKLSHDGARAILKDMPMQNGRHLGGRSPVRADGFAVVVVDPLEEMLRLQHTLFFCKCCKKLYQGVGIFLHCGNNKANKLCLGIRDDPRYDESCDRG